MRKPKNVVFFIGKDVEILLREQKKKKILMDLDQKMLTKIKNKKKHPGFQRIGMRHFR